MQTENPTAPTKIIRKSHVLDRVGVSGTTLWRMERRGEFPPHVRISTGAVGWLESDVEQWIRSRAEGSR